MKTGNQNTSQEDMLVVPNQDTTNIDTRKGGRYEKNPFQLTDLQKDVYKKYTNVFVQTPTEEKCSPTATDGTLK